MVAPGKASQFKQPAIIFSVSLGTKACHQFACAGYTGKFKYFVMREINLCFLKENPLFSVLYYPRDVSGFIEAEFVYRAFAGSVPVDAVHD